MKLNLPSQIWFTHDSIESQEHEGVAMDLKDHLAPTLPAIDRDTSHYTKLLKALSNLALNSDRIGAFTDSLSNMFQCLTTLKVQSFFH